MANQKQDKVIQMIITDNHTPFLILIEAYFHSY